MSKKFNHRALEISQKIYELLLRAYPKAHREKYGAAMAQLFRDQCRDAWNESRVWGLIKFWLRVLPDWLKTLAFEHFAALRQISPMRAFFILFLLSFFGVAATNFILPKYYVGGTRILLRFVNVEKTNMLVSIPYVIQTEMEIISSDAILSPVVKERALDTEWSKTFKKPLTIQETIKLLRHRIIITPIGSSSVVQIQVFDKNPEKARNLANAIVGSYLKNHVLRDSFERKDPSELQLANIQIVEMAHITPFPYKTKNLFLGALAGIVLGLIAAIVIKISHSISTRFSNQKMTLQD